MISAILASTSTGGIGLNGTLPWPKLSEDLKWFREHTTNQIVVMGRKTWDDPMLPKPLPNRINCVVSSSPVAPEHRQQQVKWLLGNPVEHIQRLANEYPEKTVYVIGGKRLYEACQSIVDRIYLTRIPGDWAVDTRVNLDLMLDRFCIISVRPSISSNCTYEIWERQFKS